MTRELLNLLRIYRIALPALVVLGTLAFLAEGIGIGLLIPLLDVLMGVDSPGLFGDLVRRLGGELAPSSRLSLVGAGIFGLIALKSLLSAGYVLVLAWVSNEITHTLRSGLFHQLMSVGFAFFARTDPGRLLNTLDNEAYRTGQAIGYLCTVISSLCAVGVFAVLMLVVSWQLMLALGSAILVPSLLVRGLVAKANLMGSRTVETDAELKDVLLEALRNIRLIRVYGREAAEQARLERASDAAQRAARRVDIAWFLVGPMMELLYVPVFLGALAFAWYAGIGLPVLLPFLLLAFRLQPHIKNLDDNRVRLASRAPSVAAVFALLGRADKPYLCSGREPFEGLRDSIVFDGVSFSYLDTPDAPHALDQVSLRIARGEVVGIIGHSGAGKTTLINLLCRLYDPTAGRILVDGLPLRDLDLAAWRARLAIAGQDAGLFAGTIRENIAFGQPDADLEAVVEAARQADIHGFVESLPDGYLTRVGPGGTGLSGGQRQRIGLARALLRKPDVLILDEATSEVDPASKLSIQRALDPLVGRLTIIIIAHDVGAIPSIGRIFRLSHGQVVANALPALPAEAGVSTHTT